MIDIWAQWQLDRPTVKAGRESALVPLACQIVRRAQTGTDADGQPVYGPSATVATVACEFAPTGSVERVGPERTVVSTNARFYVPEGTNVQATDEITFGGQTYPVSGVVPMGPYDVVQAVDIEEAD